MNQPRNHRICLFFSIILSWSVSQWIKSPAVKLLKFSPVQNCIHFVSLYRLDNYCNCWQTLSNLADHLPRWHDYLTGAQYTVHVSPLHNNDSIAISPDCAETASHSSTGIMPLDGKPFEHGYNATSLSTRIHQTCYKPTDISTNNSNKRE